MIYPICKIKNNTGSILRLHEYEFQPDDVFIIDDSKRIGWASNETVIESINNSTIKILDENDIIQTIENGINLLEGNIAKSKGAVCVSFGSETTIESNQYIKGSGNCSLSDTCGFIAPYSGKIVSISGGFFSVNNVCLGIRINGNSTTAKLNSNSVKAYRNNLNLSFNINDCISIYCESGSCKNPLITLFLNWSE
jgi:hypothetical protein